MVALIMKAGNVTPEEALQKAENFLQNKYSTHRASGAIPTLTMTRSISGLYVFNVGKNDGFIIVSPDDSTVEILGYSNSGQINPDNIPDNMRAWLQGYADEIAWAKEHGASNREQGVSYVPDMNVKVPIEPLIETRWDQDTPYNNLCPEYATGQHSITGCVATAMAQVMYYHKWPDATTQSIPSYNRWWSTPALPAAVTSFNWDDMQLTYNGTETSETAVATLMYYCGISVKMDYASNNNEMSGASTSDVASALKTYFNYSTTTKFVSRSFYSYGDWINLIYHELSEGRPVLYGGQSDGGGHAFVCDGYQGEDYFHINWGWSGTSDNYFKLSALNPYVQGSGGSSSNDGFHYGQEAIIGIQKPNETGTILDIPENQISLSLKSISIDKNTVSINEPVTITLKVTNNASEDYDGDLWIGSTSIGLLAGNTFFIPSGETKDCQITYTPTGFTGTINIYGYYPAKTGGYYRWTEKSVQLTVNASGGGGETNNAELTTTVTVNSSEGTNYIAGDNTPVLNIYGNTFRGTATLTNNTSTDYTGKFNWAIIPNGESGSVHEVKVTVSANSSTDIPMEVQGLDLTKDYLLATRYIKDGSYTAWEYLGYYWLNPGIAIYTADGDNTFAKPSSPYTVPENVLTVDLTGTGVTSVTKNSEPNCLYIIGVNDAVPSGLTNVITNDGSDYYATDITLTDDNDFYSPVDFNADNVSFTYHFTVGADGKKGWNSLMLPFNVSKVMADDEEIDWFRSSSDTGKNFWVKEFTSDEPAKVYFDFAQQMNANTPYIVAFPGNRWGASWDMSNKVIKFIGEDVKVRNSASPYTITGDSYRFMGRTHQVDTENIYCLNNQGDKFELTSGSGAFRAFFKPDAFDLTVTSLGIGSGIAGTTDITTLHSPSTTNHYYTLDGRRVDHPTKGLYIINGKKTVIK